MFRSIKPPRRRKSSVNRTLALPCLKWQQVIKRTVLYSCLQHHIMTEKCWHMAHSQLNTCSFNHTYVCLGTIDSIRSPCLELKSCHQPQLSLSHSRSGGESLPWSAPGSSRGSLGQTIFGGQATSPAKSWDAASARIQWGTQDRLLWSCNINDLSSKWCWHSASLRRKIEWNVLKLSSNWFKRQDGFAGCHRQSQWKVKILKTAYNDHTVEQLTNSYNIILIFHITHRHVTIYIMTQNSEQKTKVPRC